MLLMRQFSRLVGSQNGKLRTQVSLYRYTILLLSYPLYLGYNYFNDVGYLAVCAVVQPI